MSRYHKIDGWRGYSIPDLAVAGSSDTGTYSDSPCPTPLVLAELRGLRAVLKEAGIPSKVKIGASSNCFCAKRWVLVARSDFQRAEQLAKEYLEAHKGDTRFIHNAY